MCLIFEIMQIWLVYFIEPPLKHFNVGLLEIYGQVFCIAQWAVGHSFALDGPVCFSLFPASGKRDNLVKIFRFRMCYPFRAVNGAQD